MFLTDASEIENQAWLPRFDPIRMDADAFEEKGASGAYGLEMR